MNTVTPSTPRAAPPAPAVATAAVAGRRNLVVGLGQTGLSCVRYLCARGEQVAVADSRAAPPELAALGAGWPQVACRTGALDASLLDGMERVVLSPGVDRRGELVRSALAAGVPVVGDVELFAEDLRATQPAAAVVGITGTNGKSTVTALVAEIAERAGIRVRAGANFGPPALELLEPPRPDLYVLELSSFQLESTQTLDLRVAVLLNLTPDHMDRYDALGDYAAAKARITRRAQLVVLNADDDLLAPMVPVGCAVRTFSVLGDADYHLAAVDGRTALMAGRGGDGEPVIAAADLRVGGRHNLANALAALATVEALGLSRDAVRGALSEFTGLAHRMQVVARRGDVTFIDDSKGTNVGATLAAVGGLEGPIVLVAGGDGKGQDFAPLAPACRGKVRHAVLLGRDRAALAAVLAGVCTTECVTEMPQAVRAAAAAARPGDVVLLSPACASLDMFRNYAERGEAFARAVRELN